MVVASGANVSLNKGTSVPNGATARVYHGDEVVTGPASSALVTFDAGGFIQLDEETDPLFEYLQGQAMLLIRIFYGIAHLDSQNNTNIQVKCDEANAFLKSVINIRAVKGGQTTFTVVSGSLRVVPLNTQLQPALLKASGQQVTVSKVRIEPIKVLPTQELQAVTKWRDKFPAIKLRIEKLPAQPLISPTPRELAPRR